MKALRLCNILRTSPSLFLFSRAEDLNRHEYESAYCLPKSMGEH